MKNKSLFFLHKLISSRKISSLDLSKYFLKNIENNYYLNSIININYKDIFYQAKKADFLINKKYNNFLTGIPFLIKDIFNKKNFITTSGSKILKNYISPYNSNIINKLLNLNLIFVGKLNMDEFGIGSNNFNYFYGSCFNPWCEFITPGGSSGGSGVSISSRLNYFSVATDTGGSIRVPSFLNNIVGIKPTYGRISRQGVIPYSSSLDQPGILSKSILDCSIILNSLCGLDLKDSTTLSFKKEDFTRYINKKWLLNKSGKVFIGLCVGISKSYFFDIIDFDIRSNFEYILTEFEFLGAKILYICFFDFNLITLIYYIISSCELSSNLFRFDGFIYGLKFYGNRNFKYSEFFRTKLFSNIIKNRILLGNYILSSDDKKKYFFLSKKIRRLIIEDFQKKFKICDIILSPILPYHSWFSFLKENNFFEKTFIDIYNLAANIAGLPFVSLPSGFFYKYNSWIPLGVQIIGNYCKEARIIQIAYEFEKINLWNKNISFNVV